MGGCVDSWETGRRAGGAGRSQGLSTWEKRQNPGASPAPCWACTAVSTAGRGREGRTVPQIASVVMWLAARPARGAMTLPLPLFSPRIRSLSPLPRARRPEPSGPGFSSWTRNTGGDGDGLTPGAQEEKLRNNPLAGPTCMQARTRVSGNLGSGCRPPVSSGASTCQRRGPSPGRRPLGCGDLASCPSSIATPTGPGNNDLRGL